MIAADMSNLVPLKGKCVVLYTSSASNQLFEVLRTPRNRTALWHALQSPRVASPASTARALTALWPCTGRQVAWRKLETTLQGRDVDYTAVDGTEDADKRRALWELSNQRTYPQVFLPEESAEHGLRFVGSMDEIQEVLARAPRTQAVLTAPAAPRAFRTLACHARAQTRLSCDVVLAPLRS